MAESIHAFLNERKELWLKDRIKKAENESVIAELQQQAKDKFSLNDIGALDIRVQCSGFIYGVSIAEQYIKTGQFNNILVIVS